MLLTENELIGTPAEADLWAIKYRYFRHLVLISIYLLDNVVNMPNTMRYFTVCFITLQFP